MSKKLTIEYAKSLAVSRGGKCLSEAYVGAHSPLEWECGDCGYKWQANLSSVKNANRWCPACGGTQKLTQEKVEELIKSRGGTCLSVYENCWSPLKIICINGHHFGLNWNHMTHLGRWCPTCSSKKSISESVCRKFFEQIFGHLFLTVRPKWLMSDLNYPLELDGYCEELSLAFEHNGSQHYKRRPNMTPAEFDRLLKNDIRKKELCAQNNVKLIIIPELFRKVAIHNLKGYIKQECIKMDIELPANIDLIEINVNEIYCQEILKKDDQTMFQEQEIS